MSYLLDANVLIHFFQARRQAELAAASVTVSLAIADAVEKELGDHRKEGPAFRAWLPTTRIAVLPVLVGSLAEKLKTRLETGITSPRGKGERASIALAACDADLIFTAMDSNAMWLALRELWAPGERMVGFPVFLRRLVEAGVLDRPVADEIMRHARQTQPLPIWWADWTP